jgi:hypothetical protein
VVRHFWAFPQLITVLPPLPALTLTTRIVKSALTGTAQARCTCMRALLLLYYPVRQGACLTRKLDSNEEEKSIVKTNEVVDPGAVFISSVWPPDRVNK